VESIELSWEAVTGIAIALAMCAVAVYYNLRARRTP